MTPVPKSVVRAIDKADLRGLADALERMPLGKLIPADAERALPPLPGSVRQSLTFHPNLDGLTRFVSVGQRLSKAGLTNRKSR